MNYKFLSAFALVCSMYTDIKANQQPQAQVAPAQVAPAGLKIGFVDFGYVLGMLSETKKNNLEIRSFQKQLDNQIQTKVKEYQGKIELFQQQLDTLTNDLKKQKGMELQKLEMEIRGLEEEKPGKMAAKYREVMQPLHDKMQEVIDKIAAKHNYDFVFNKNTDAGPVILFGKKAFDLSDLVLERLKEMAPKVAAVPPIVGAQQAKPGKKK